jgi:hypothetical protein
MEISRALGEARQKLFLHFAYSFVSFMLQQYFFYNLFTESTDIHFRYEVPREEPREAHGYFGSNLC